MDAKDKHIEQLQVKMVGLKGLLNEITSIVRLFMPLLEQSPYSDKRMVGELNKRLQITEMMLSMDRNDPPSIVESSGF
jgi:hypothetical protein